MQIRLLWLLLVLLPVSVTGAEINIKDKVIFYGLSYLLQQGETKESIKQKICDEDFFYKRKSSIACNESINILYNLPQISNIAYIPKEYEEVRCRFYVVVRINKKTSPDLYYVLTEWLQQCDNLSYRDDEFLIEWSKKDSLVLSLTQDIYWENRKDSILVEILIKSPTKDQQKLVNLLLDNPLINRHIDVPLILDSDYSQSSLCNILTKV